MRNVASRSPAVPSVDGSAKSVLLQKRELVEQKIAVHHTATLAIENMLGTHREKIHKLNKTLNSTSPILATLPLDVVSEIFTLASDSQNETYRWKIPFPFPFVIGRVCKAWRQIVWSTPLCWSNIAIRFSQKNIRSQEQLLREWIGRSKACPLDLYLLSCGTRKWEPPISTFLLLLECCNRWRTLDSYAFTNLSLALTRGYSFPSLRVLKLKEVLIRDKDTWAFNLPNQLRSLDSSDIPPSALRIDWTSLHSLNATLTAAACMQTLVLCSSLKSCKVGLLSQEGISEIHQNKTVHCVPHLTRLEISGDICTIISFLQRISVPSLELLHLDFHAYGEPTRRPWPRVVSNLIGRSSCSLTDLKVEGEFVAEAEGDIIEMLGQLPSIKHLTLECQSPFKLSDLMIERLDPRINGAFLPHLATFRYDGEICFLPASMLVMIRSRLHFFESGREVTNSSGTSYTMHQLDTIKITYSNGEWTTKENPNFLKYFYQQLVPFSARGTTLSLAWDGDDDFEP